MTLVRLSDNGTSTVVDAVVTYGLALPAARTALEATVLVPYARLPLPGLRSDGGSILEVYGATRWLGIADAPRQERDGVVVRGLSFWKWLDGLPAPRRTYYGCSAAAIAKDVLASVVRGTSLPFRLGQFVEGAPILPVFTPTGSVLATLVALQEQTGQELSVDASLTLGWVPWVVRPRPLVLVDTTQQVGRPEGESLTEIARGILEVRGGLPWVVEDRRVPGTWPRVVTIGG